MDFEKMTLEAFVDELASDSPAPGGGSIAALCGSLAAGLSLMVANLTVGKEKYKDNWQIADEIIKKGTLLKEEFLGLINKDTVAFNTFMTALKMPKSTDEEKAKRKVAMANAAIEMTIIPLTTLETCPKVLEIAQLAAEHGNPNALSDAGVAALLGLAAAKAAAYNVKINLPSVKDLSKAEEFKTRMNVALVKTSEKALYIETLVNKALD